MANRETKNSINDERIEDITQFGEFIPSFDQWTTFENQRKRAEHIEDCTKSKKK